MSQLWWLQRICRATSKRISAVSGSKITESRSTFRLWPCCWSWIRQRKYNGIDMLWTYLLYMCLLHHCRCHHPRHMPYNACQLVSRMKDANQNVKLILTNLHHLSTSEHLSKKCVNCRVRLWMLNKCVKFCTEVLTIHHLNSNRIAA